MVRFAAPTRAILLSDASLLLQGSSNASVRTCDELKLSKIWCSGQILPKVWCSGPVGILALPNQMAFHVVS